ncbi:MAG: 2-C-methyl-D-erythritol 4-phosphate cytidylyltransferase [Paludibacter sp.]|nr:2-C-methyl-D-erythritol 4-phosphate cytidylyltransferase [Paludibacter sp.]
MQKSKAVIIVAGGKGLRMNSDIPKQFIPINGFPVLMHTIRAFQNFNNKIQIIVVLPENQMSYWAGLCKKYAFDVKHEIAPGGETRFHSVKNGLKLINMPAIVAVHDGVRPFVSNNTIIKCFDAAEEYGTVIPVVDAVDSIRQITPHGNLSVDRNLYKMVQTPQVFDGELLLRAYEQTFSPLFTDDASVVESLGHKITLVEGNRENIKLTTAIDLEWAKIISKRFNE